MAEETQTAANPADEMTFLEHLEEMRTVILKSLGVFMVAFVIVICGFYYFNKAMLMPLNSAKKILASYVGQEQTAKTSVKDQTLGPVYLEMEREGKKDRVGPLYIVPKDDSVVLVKNPPSSGNWVADIKLRSMSITTPIYVWLSVGFLGSLGMALPFVAYFVARFVMPGLTEQELKMLAPGAIAGTILFFVGAAFAFFFMLPMGIAFMAWMSQGMQLEMFPDAMSYYTMVIFVTIATGLTFELPLLEFILIYLGVLNVEWLKKNRRMVILILVVFAAIVTPPDCITQISLATPLYLLYEVSLRLGERARKRKLAREAAEEAAEKEREEREEAEYVKEEARRRLAEEKEEKIAEANEGAKAIAEDNAAPYDNLEDSAYEELDTLEDDYDYDTYMRELESTTSEGYINYGDLAKGAPDTSVLSPDWSLNEPDTSLMSPDWSLNEPKQSSEFSQDHGQRQDQPPDSGAEGSRGGGEKAAEGSLEGEGARAESGRNDATEDRCKKPENASPEEGKNLKENSADEKTADK